MGLQVPSHPETSVCEGSVSAVASTGLPTAGNRSEVTPPGSSKQVSCRPWEVGALHLGMCTDIMYVHMIYV